MNKKAIILLIGIVTISLAAPMVFASNTEVTGSFDCNATLDVDVNRSSIDFGNISVSDSQMQGLFVENNGTVIADVTQGQATKDSGTLTIGTNGSLANNEYGVTVLSDGNTSEEDIGGGYSSPIDLADGLAAGSVRGYNLTLYIGPSLTAAYYEDETFIVDISVVADT